MDSQEVAENSVVLGAGSECCAVQSPGENLFLSLKKMVR